MERELALLPVSVQRQLGAELPAAGAAGVGEQAGEVLGLYVHPDVGDGLVPVDAAQAAGDVLRAPDQVAVKVRQTADLPTIRGQAYNFNIKLHFHKIFEN